MRGSASGALSLIISQLLRCATESAPTPERLVRRSAREGAVRPVVVVEVLPLGKPLRQIHIDRVAQELVELLLITGL